MFLANWFHCVELQLLPAEAADYLDVLRCLEDDNAPAELTGFALDALDRSDARLRAYAVPALMRCVCRRADDALRRRAVAGVSALVPAMAAGDLAGFLELGRAEQETLIRSAGAVPVRGDHGLRADGPGDSAAAAGVALALTLIIELQRAGRQNPGPNPNPGDPDDPDDPGGLDDVDVVEGLLRGDDRLGFVDAARAGLHGGRARSLTIEALLNAGEPAKALSWELTTTTKGSWLGSPDLIRAQLLLALAERGIESPAQRAVWLVAEAAHLHAIPGAALHAATRPTESRPGPDLAWLRLRVDDTPAAAVVLWQAVAYEMAVDEHVEAAAEALREIWGAPTPFAKGVAHVRHPAPAGHLNPPLQRLVGLRRPHPAGDGKPVQVALHVDTEPSFPGVARLVHSPWLDRATPAYKATSDIDVDVAPQVFPAIDDDLAMLRMFATTETLVTAVVGLHRVGSAVPDELWDAVLNAFDVRASARLRDVLETLSRGRPVLPDRHRLSAVVLALGVAFLRQLDRLGKGRLHPDVPAGLVHRIQWVDSRLRSSSARKFSPQRRALYSQAAAMSAAHLAYEVLSGRVSLETDGGSQPWFVGASGAPAARITRLLLGPLWDRVQKEARTVPEVGHPALSIQEPAALARDAFPDMLEPRRRSWDWLRLYGRPKGKPGNRLVFLSEPLKLDTWRSIDPLDPGRLVRSWLMVQTLRLAELLAAQDVADDHPWYREWCEAIDRVNTPRLLSRDLRTVLIDLIATPPGTATAVDVQRRALATVMEFSGATAHYQELTGRALLHPGRPVDDVVDDLGKDWLYAVVQGAQKRSRPFREGPWGLAAAAETQRLQALMAERFLLDARERGYHVATFGPVLDHLDDPVAAMAVETDPATVATHRVLLQRRTRRGVVAVLAPHPTSTVPDPFRTAVGSSADRLGLVADRDPRTGRVLINIGGAEPVLAGEVDGPVGAPKVVRPDPLMVFNPARPALPPGRQRPATVTWDGAAIVVAPADEPAWSVPVGSADLLTRWLPDALAAASGPYRGSCHVQWQPGTGWVPAVADFLRLIVREFGAAPNAVVLTVCERQAGQDSWLLAAAPGRSYFVPSRRISPELLMALERVAQEWGSVGGLRLGVRLDHDPGGALLAPAQPDPLDDRNLHRTVQFDDGATRLARWDGQRWLLDADAEAAPDLADTITTVELPPPSGDGVELAVRVVGWNEWAQRRGRADVEVLTAAAPEATAADGAPPTRAAGRGPRRPVRHGRRPDYVPVLDEQDRLLEAAEPSGEWRAAFEAWLQAGNPHVEAALVSGRREATLLGLFVPADSRADSARVDTVPLAVGEQPWLHGRGYDRSRARVQLLEQGGRWRASYRHAAPLTLAEFTRRVLGRDGDAGRFQMWFAGRTAQDDYRFEWGYGWTLVLRPDELDVDGLGGLFFGDGARQLRLVHDGPGATPRLRIGHISWAVERRIHEDAKERVLHAVQVRVDTNGAGVRFANIRGVQLRSRDVPRAGAVDRATSFARVANADFDQASQALILEATRSGVDTVTVLARLKTQLLPVHGNGARLTFVAVLPGDPTLAGTEHAPQENESVVLVADEITPTEGNDYVIAFHEPNPDGEQPALTVTVLRRQFSLRESTLREAFRRDPREFSGVPMLVRLTRRRGERWDGSVIDAPPRTARNLLDWAASDPDRAYVTVGAVDKPGHRIKIEARPGVLALLPIVRQHVPARQAVCRLRVTPQGHSLDVVVRSDLDYVPQGGRAVELLLKDDMLRPVPRHRSTGGFTVSGFPGLDFQDPDTAWRARRWQPPRLAALVRGPTGSVTIDPAAALHTGRLVAGGPRVLAVGRGRAPSGLDWPQLSFHDGHPDDLARHAERGLWRYHDRRTGWFDSSGTFNPVPLPDPVRGHDGPLHFDGDWHLRYRTGELRRFGFSAKQLLEHGLPVDADWYPVAAASADGLWVELSPGRVVELGEGLLHAPAGVDSILTGFAWSHFSPGDLVRLQGITERDTETIAFRLVDWSPGPRGWFGAARALLPVARVDGGFDLGRGDVGLGWSGRTVPMGDVAWLRPDNTLSGYDADIRAGDVVLIGLGDDGRLEVAGAPHLRVESSPDWAEVTWLGDALRRCDREAVLGLGGTVPVTVAAVDAASVLVAPAPGPQRPVRRWAGRIQLVTGDDAIVRSGSRWLQVPLAELLPGVPAAARPAAARVLAGRRELLWGNRGADSVPARGDRTATGVHNVTVLAAAGEGLLVRSADDLAMEWLPLAELGWVGGVPAADVLDLVREVGDELAVVPLGPPGVVSFLAGPAGTEVRRRVSAGEVEVVPRRVLAGTATGGRYLASVGRAPAVLVVDSERELVLGHPTQVDTEVDAGDVHAIPTGSARTALDLSPWLVEILRVTRDDGMRLPALVATKIRARAEHYSTALATGMPATPEERLVVAAFGVDAPAQDDALRQWLTGPGRALLTGRAFEVSDPSGAWCDVLPAVAATLLLHRSADPAARTLAVHAVHTLGLLATGCLHEESLLRHWLAVGGHGEATGRWSRLARLDLGGRRLFGSPAVPPSAPGAVPVDDPYITIGAANDPHFDGLLTAEQLDQVRLCCSGILSAWREPDPALTATARALLFATGQDVEPVTLLADLEGTELWALAALGRALTPGFTEPVSQSRLAPGQTQVVEKIGATILGDGIPLSFRPANRLNLPQQSVTWASARIEQLVS